MIQKKLKEKNAVNWYSSKFYMVLPSYNNKWRWLVQIIAD